MLEVISAGQGDSPIYEVRIASQMPSQGVNVAGIHQIDGMAECRIADALVCRQFEYAGIVVFDERFQLRPTRKAVLTRDCELRIA